MITMLVLTACGPEVAKPYTTISPASPTADDVQSLYELVFWLALIVFIGVQFAIVYTALRFRRTKPAKQRPPQVHGNKRLEIIWTVIPAVVLLVILIPTITTLYDHDAAAEEGDIVIDVYGKQWWWEVHYGEDKSQGGENLGVITANEIHIPVGKEVVFNLRTNNVIHSFWVPRLSGKMDLMPGHNNTLSITATEAGELLRRVRRVLRRPARLDALQGGRPRRTTSSTPGSMPSASATRPPPNADGELPEGVAAGARRPSASASPATPSMASIRTSLTGLEAPSNIGPDLTNLACRDTIAAGMLINQPREPRAWVDDPGCGQTWQLHGRPDYTEDLIRDTYGDDGVQRADRLPDGAAARRRLRRLGCGTAGATPVASPGVAGGDSAPDRVATVRSIGGIVWIAGWLRHSGAHRNVVGAAGWHR